MSGYVFKSGCLVVKVKYLHRKKSGLYCFRRGIPAPLREFYDGRRELIFSLQTHNESEAVRRIQPYAARYDSEFKTIANTGTRDKATAFLKTHGLEPVPLPDQPAYLNSDDYDADGSPYNELRLTLESKHDIGGRSSPLEAHEKRALDILHGEEKLTLLDVELRAEGLATTHKKRVENKRFFRCFTQHLPTNVLGSIRRRHVQDAVDKLLASGLKTASVKKPLDYVRRHIRETILLHELRIENPFDHVKVKGHGTDVKKRKPFSLAELNTVKQTIIEKMHLPTAQIVGLLTDTGCRNGEVGGIRLDHINLDHAVPHLKISEQSNRRLKNKNSARLVPLVGLSLLTAQHIKAVAVAGQVYAFENYNPDDHYHNDNCSAAVNKFIRGLSASHTSHSFRHSLRDRLVEASVAAYEIENIQGWSSDKMVDHYGVSTGLDRLHDALQKMMAHESE